MTRARKAKSGPRLRLTTLEHLKIVNDEGEVPVPTLQIPQKPPYAGHCGGSSTPVPSSQMLAKYQEQEEA
jgi:hypothetical protein